MRIACLQFSPQVGDTDNNLNRGDAVLNKAKPEELEALDLLILPEMAFSGYNFKSLQQIHPFLEPSGSGMSSLWARTTALKFNTKVLVGYPEKVDISKNWPASPEYYDSAIMVNGEGETVLNYRKNFLHKTDQTWALEGPGFYCEDIEGIGKTCVGICMDLNPYRNESPWHAFEFAYHALEVEAELVVVCMSWITRQDHREFSRTLAEPDMETLTYWVQRLEPLILAELEREIIVVFCNRCGQEDEALYAGTSAIIGIQGGEVNVYALAGRGTKEYLMADTNNAPFAKLIQNQDEEEHHVRDVPASIASMLNREPAARATPPPPPPPPPAPIPAVRNARTNQAVPDNLAHGNAIVPPRSVPPGGKKQRPSPKLQIPHLPSHSFSSMSAPVGGPFPAGNHIPESPIMIPTPEAPSPTPMAIRPKLIMPETATAFGDNRRPSPYPHDNFLMEQFRFFGSRHQPLTPIVSNDEGERASSRYYWKPSDTLLNTPYEYNWEPEPDTPIVPAMNPLAPLTPFPGAYLPDRTRSSSDANRGLRHISHETLGRPEKVPKQDKHQKQDRQQRQDKQQKQDRPVRSEKLVKAEKPGMTRSHDSPPEASKPHPSTNSGTPIKADLAQNPADSLETSQKAALHPRPASPKSRSASRSGVQSRNGANIQRPSNSNPASQPADSGTDRTASAADFRPTDSRPWLDNANIVEQSRHARPGSPKSRNASRNRRLTGDSVPDHYGANISYSSNTPTVAPSFSSNSDKPPAVEAAGRPPSRTGSEVRDAKDAPRPASRATHRAVDVNEIRPRSDSIVQATMDQNGPNPVENILTRLGMRPQTPRGNMSDTRPQSRGRPRVPVGEGSEAPQPTGGGDKQRRLSQIQVRDGPPAVPRHVSITRMQSASRLADVRMATPDDEIIAIEEYTDPTCQLHNRRAASTGAVSHKIPSIADGRAILGMIANLPPPPPVYRLGGDDDSDSDPESGERPALKSGPSVLGGRIRTTIVTAPAGGGGGSGVSVMTPLYSAVSVSSVFSAFTHLTMERPGPETPALEPTPTRAAPPQQQQPDQSLTPRGMTGTPKPMTLRLGDPDNLDIPYAPLTCNHCGHMEKEQSMQIDALVASGIEERPRSW